MHWRVLEYMYLLEVIENGRVLFGEEGDSDSRLACPPGSANPVCVVLDGLCHVIVDDIGDVSAHGTW